MNPALITGGTNHGCAGFTDTLSDAIIGGIWSSGNTAVAAIDSAGVVTTVGGGTATISYTLGNGCNTSYLISVNPTPVLSSTLLPPSICSGQLFSYVPTSTTFATAFAWHRPYVPGISNPAASGMFNPYEYLVNTTATSLSVIYVYTLTANGCSNTQNVKVEVDTCTTLAVQILQAESNTLAIFPNPATTQLTIQSTNEPINGVIITNILGQVMTSLQPSPKEREVLSVDVSGWPGGVYFVRVNGASATLSMAKFVKE